MYDTQLPPHYEVVETSTEAPTALALRLAGEGAEEGTLVHRPFTSPLSNLDCALVLEPEVPVDRYFEMGFVASVSLGQAVAASASPMITLQYGWPDRIVLNDLAVARVTLQSGRSDSTYPPLGQLDAGTLRSVDSENQATADELMSLFGRHFLHWINTWHEEGFNSVLAQYTPRLDRAYGSTVAIATRAGKPESSTEGVIEQVDDAGVLHLSARESGQIALSPHEYYGLGS